MFSSTRLFARAIKSAVAQCEMDGAFASCLSALLLEMASVYSISLSTSDEDDKEAGFTRSVSLKAARLKAYMRAYIELSLQLVVLSQAREISFQYRKSVGVI